MTGAPRVDVAATPAAPSKLTRYVWLVLASAFLAWMFDSIALNVFNLVLTPSLTDLLHTHDHGRIAAVGGSIVAIKLFAWGVGGTIFGVLTDRFGRARIMLVTIAIYCIGTALSAVSQNWVELAVFQALAGLGIGGEWSAGAALLAETLPERRRPALMIVMQLAFSVGYFLAAFVNLTVGPHGWRWVLVACGVPGIAVILLRLFVAEPKRWVATQERGRPMGSLVRLFDRNLRRRTIGGFLSAMALMVGSFAATTFVPSWIAELSAQAGPATVVRYVSYFAMLLNAGAAVGYLTLIWLTQTIGRRPSYFIFCLGSLVTAIVIFTTLDSTRSILIAAPIIGFFMLGGFGVFAVYLPELFPTTVRATGQGL
ncbi:MAG: major facilitator superfamily, partial [Streptosporangiaceae bacterium]|nr:major facilitator superfamily [Streptosporangiaceae bacterium]